MPVTDSRSRFQTSRLRLHANHARIHAAFIYYQRLQRVREFVNQNYTEEISLKKAAEIAGLEKKYFSTYFREKTGVCFKDWIAEVRVSRAKSMMELQNYNITEIGFAVGFRDLRTFERAFKRCTGMTPRAFKNSVRPS